MGRNVTVGTSAQIESRPSDQDVVNHLTRELRNNGIGVTRVTVDRSWFNTLARIEITLVALDNQSVQQVETILTVAMQNIANLSAADPMAVQIWNPQLATVISGHWSLNAGAYQGGGFNPTPTTTTPTGQTPSGTGSNWTPYAYTAPGTSAGPNGAPPPAADDDPFKSLTDWLSTHSTEAALGMVVLVLLVKR